MKQILKIIAFIISLTIFINANDDININDKIKLAKEQNKHLMIFFHIPGCPYCKSMLNENFKDNEMIQKIKDDFILINLYTADDYFITFDDFDGDIQEFATRIGAFAFPSTIFIDKNKKVVFKSIGYRDTPGHLAELEYVSAKNYKTTSFKEYKEKLDFDKDD